MKHVIAIVFGLFLSFTAITPVLAFSAACPACEIKIGIGTTTITTVDMSEGIVEFDPNLYILDPSIAQSYFQEVGFRSDFTIFDPDHARAEFGFGVRNNTDKPLSFFMDMDMPINLNGTIEASSELHFFLHDLGISQTVLFTSGTQNSPPTRFTDFSSTGSPSRTGLCVCRGYRSTLLYRI